MILAGRHGRSAFLRRGSSSRTGAAAVEFALICPVLFLVFLGVIEFGRAMMVSEILNTAVRTGCRAGTMIGATNSSVTSGVTQCLTGISGTTTTIQVNGATGDVSTAARGDSISVQLQVPYSSVSWLPGSMFLGNTTLSATAVMYHE